VARLGDGHDEEKTMRYRLMDEYVTDRPLWRDDR
jgi:hypothetical protein